MQRLQVGQSDGSEDSTFGFEWVRLDWQDEADCAWLRNDSGLDAITVNALLDEYTRPRAFCSESGGWVITLRSMAAGQERPPLIASIRMCVTRRQVITISKVELAMIPALIERAQRQTGKRYSSVRFLLTVCDTIERQFTGYLAELEERVGVEEEALEERDALSDAALRSLRLEVSRLRRHLSPMREAVQQLLRLAQEQPLGGSGSTRAQQASQWREILNSVARNIETVNELTERLQILRDALRSRADQRLQSIMYLLTIAATFFLPLTFIASLLGMNVGGIPGANHALGFWSVSAILVTLAALQWWLFRRWRWLGESDE